MITSDCNIGNHEDLYFKILLEGDHFIGYTNV